MNYLAHAYLSFNDAGILVGNMISDFVKGKKKFDYPERIQKGIALHRLIDTFTDDHPVTMKAKSFFRKDYRLYAGAFVDVAYDHFLAKQFDEEVLKQFAAGTYSVLTDHFAFLPERFQRMLPYMREENWLYNYRFNRGTEKSFWGLTRRAKYIESEAAAIEIFHLHYSELEKCFNDFFPQLYSITKSEFGKLTA